MGPVQAMPESAPNLPLPELLEHSTWVRDLARRLARDPTSADDLAQSTWLAALEHPPASDRPLRQWLGTVVRNFALQSRRGESRRAERERRAARAEAVPSTDELLERASMQRRVVTAVMGLEEPYRTAILLRFLEELPPREIARRLDVPVETVRTRVTRGIERLRKRLDADHGGDGRAWLAALLPLTERPWGAVPAALGATVVNVKLIASVAAVSVLGVGAWFAFESASEPASPAVVAAAAPDEEQAPVERDSSTALPAAAEREAIRVPDEPAAPAPAAVAPAEAALGPVRGVVLDASGNGVAGVPVELTPGAGGDDAVARATSASGGAFELATNASSGRLRAVDPDRTTVFASHFNRDQSVDPVLVVAPRLELAGEVVDAAGGTLPGASVTVSLPADFRTRFDAVLDNVVEGEWGSATDGDGRFALDDVPFVDGARLRVSLEGFVPYVAALAPGSDTSMRVVLQQPAADGLVRGVVVDRSGTPVDEAHVALGADSTVTGADGAFTFLLDDPESFGARFGIPADALTAAKPGLLPTRWAPPTEGGRPQWPAHVTLVLDGETFTLAGRVVDHLGEAVPAARVWIADTTFFGAVGGRAAQLENLLAGSAGSFWHFVAADDEGRFEVVGLTEREYTLRAMDTETMLMSEAGPFSAGTRGVELVLPTDQLHARVAGRVTSHAGDPIANVSVVPMCDAHQARVQGRVIGTSHMTVEGTRTDADGNFELRNVPRSLVYLRIDGESILPLEYGRPHDGTDPRFAHLPKELPEHAVDRLEIQVAQRSHLVVELTEPGSADAVAVLTAEGRPVTLSIITATGRRDGPRLPILGERSDTMAVPDNGTTVVLYRNGEEVGRVPVQLLPGEVTTTTF